MRFRGTLVLAVIAIGVGAFVYFYEIKGGEQREKAKQAENRLWKVESNDIQQIDLVMPEQHITAVRTGEKSWKITAPRALDADGEELNRLAGTASDLNRESVIEPAASDLSRFGLEPPQVALQIRMKDGKEHKVRFGNNNPTGNSTYASLEGGREVFLIANHTASTFKKKLEDLRNHSVLSFDQFEAQRVELKNEKAAVSLAKDGDRWFLEGGEKWAADSSAVSTLVSALSSGRVKEFFEGDPADYAALGFDKPSVDVRVTYGKDRAMKHLTVGLPKSKLVKKGEKKPAGKGEGDESAELWVARDESRSELFFIDKDLFDKLQKTPAELRDKALATFPRWDANEVVLTNSKGTFTFKKDGSGGDWVLGDAKKKTKWDALNGIFDAIEKPVKEFIDNPAPLATYGLDKPVIRVVVRQGETVKVDCAVGKEAQDGVYAKVAGEAAVKIADKEILQNLEKGEADFVEPPPPAQAPAKK